MRKSAPLRWTQLLACAYGLLGAIACHARWMPAAFIGTLLFTVALRVVLRRYSTRIVPWPLKLVLLVAFGYLVVRYFHNFFGREAGSGLLAAMLALKLVETETRRDGLLLLAFSCFLAMSAFLFDQGLIQSTIAAVTVALLVASLNVLQPFPDDAPSDATRARWWPYSDLALGGLVRLMLLALPFAGACFLFFPRIDQPMWGAPEDVVGNRSGIDDVMSPGSLSRIALDDRTAFRVRFETATPPPQDRYFRMLVLSEFDGESWRADRWNPSGGSFRAEALGPEVEYQIQLEPTDKRWLPLLDMPLAAPEGASVDLAMQATSGQALSSPTEYRGRSAPRYRLETLPPIGRNWLRLPSRTNPAARALGQRWRDEIGDQAKIVETALALYRDSFIYTLDPPPMGANPIDDFLFNWKAGYCEHFAGSFVFLMRSADIPARVVIGYQGGYYNPVGNFFNVRYSEAHAWAEIWISGRGWVRVDPTAAVSPDRVERGSLAQLAASQTFFGKSGGFWSSVRDRFDMVGYWWNNAVVQFSALRQRDFVEALGLGRATEYALTILFVLGALVTLAIAGGLVARRRRVAPDPLLDEYRRYCARLAGAGMPRAANEGPRAFGARAMAEFPEAAAEIEALTSGYVRLRYDAAVSQGSTQRDAWIRRARRFRVATRRRARPS